MKFIKDNEIPWDRSFGMIARLRMCDKTYGGQIIRLIPEEYECGGNLDDTDTTYELDFSVGKGTAATAEVICEMLLQSQSGDIHVFPAWDENVGDAAFFSLRARNAFLVSAEMREGKTAYIIVTSLKGNTCRVVDNFGDGVRVRNLETNEELEFRRDNDVLVFNTVPCHEYVIENRERPLESFPVID